MYVGKNNPGFVYTVTGPGLTIVIRGGKKEFWGYYSSIKVPAQCSVAV